MVGSLFGVGFIAVGSAFNFQKMRDSFMLPLLLSPIIAAFSAMVVYLLFSKTRKALGITKNACVCVTENNRSKIQCDNMVATLNKESSIHVISCNVNSETYDRAILGISIQKIVDVFYFVSAGTVGFARGLNDTPKIAGILLILGSVNSNWVLLLVTIAMALGGILKAKKVADTMSDKITPMNSGQGFTANFVTSILVLLSSFFSLPVSTTHVSVGSIFGIGTVNKTANPKMILKIVSSWLLTLPVAALSSGFLFLILKYLFK